MKKIYLAQVITVVALISITGCKSTGNNAQGNTPTVNGGVPLSSVPGNSTPSNVNFKVVHTPKIVVNDAKTSGCVLRVSDADGHIYVVNDSTKNNSVVASLLNKGDVLPDPSCTPGGIDPAVTQSNLMSTICSKGYTKTVRPSASATGKFKKISYGAYSETTSRHTELDHFIPLEVGGASDTSNLWPETNSSAARGVVNPKDAVENKLNKAVCTNKVTLLQAQMAITTNWVTALKDLKIS